MSFPSVYISPSVARTTVFCESKKFNSTNRQARSDKQLSGALTLLAVDTLLLGTDAAFEYSHCLTLTSRMLTKVMIAFALGLYSSRNTLHIKACFYLFVFLSVCVDVRVEFLRLDPRVEAFLRPSIRRCSAAAATGSSFCDHPQRTG